MEVCSDDVDDVGDIVDGVDVDGDNDDDDDPYVSHVIQRRSMDQSWSSNPGLGC